MSQRLFLCTNFVFFFIVLVYIGLLAFFPGTFKDVRCKDTGLLSGAPLKLNATGSSSQNFELGWGGTRCGRGSYLTHWKLRKDCRDPSTASMPVFSSYCERILTECKPPCGFYESGRFDRPLSVMPLAALEPLLGDKGSACASRAMYKGPQSNATIAVDAGDGFPGDFALRPAACPGYRYFTPLEALSILHHASIGRSGRGILLTGDSMMRQLLLRVVFYLRGESYFSEHFFHADALYVVYEDRDELTIRPSCAERALVERHFPGFPLESLSGAPCGPAAPVRGRVLLALLFLWDVRPQSFRTEPFVMSAPPVHLATFTYWWMPDSDRAEDIQIYMKRVGEKLLDYRGGEATRFIFSTAPRTYLSTNDIVPNEVRVMRNAEVWKVLRSFAQHRNVSASLIDFAALADVRHVGRSIDLMHYMCIWGTEYPGQIDMQKNNLNNCRDPVNLAQFQWMLHLLLTDVVL